jgi:PAS domain S-box-containing protein
LRAGSDRSLRPGKPDGFTKILRDLTQQQQGKEERERLVAELKTLNETLEQRVRERTRELERRTQELETSNEELYKSQQRFSQAFHSAPVASCLTTLGEEHFLEVNTAFVELTGYSKDEVVGKSHKELKQWSSPEDLALLRRLGEKPFRNQEMTLRTRRGEVCTVLLSREIIELGGERVNLKQFYDITERKRNETQMMDALKRVMSDTSWFAQKVMEELAEVRIGGQEPVPRVDLSKREREVLERLARGASNDAIAEDLGIATQTVRNYISILYDKLGVHSRGGAIIWARERGLI